MNDITLQVKDILSGSDAILGTRDGYTVARYIIDALGTHDKLVLDFSSTSTVSLSGSVAMWQSTVQALGTGVFERLICKNASPFVAQQIDYGANEALRESSNNHVDLLANK